MLAFLSFVGIVLLPPSLGAWFPERYDPPESEKDLVAPDGASVLKWRTTIADAVPAERERLARMDMVAKPYRVPLSIETTKVPVDPALGGFADYAARTSFVGAKAAMREAGCVDQSASSRDGETIEPGEQAKLLAAKSELAKLRPGAGAAGVALARVHYHIGVIEMCLGNPGGAAQSFAAAAKAVPDSGLPAGQADAAKQYAYVSTLGQRMAILEGNQQARAGSGDGELPEPTLPPESLTAAACPAYRDGCPLFLWPRARIALARVHEYTRNVEADAADYAADLDAARGAEGGLALRNLSIVVAGYAKAGRFTEIEGLLRGTDFARFGDEADCEARGRVYNLGWIVGAEPDPNLTCYPPAEGSWASEGLSPADDKQMLAWKQVRAIREDLREYKFGGLVAAGSAVSDNNLTPDDSAFITRARAQILDRQAAPMLERAVKLGDDVDDKEPNRVALLSLLCSEAFPYRTRFEATLEDSRGLGLVAATLVAAGLGLLWWLLAWGVANVLLGYGLMFTRRHHIERLKWPQP